MAFTMCQTSKAFELFKLLCFYYKLSWYLLLQEVVFLKVVLCSSKRRKVIKFLKKNMIILNECFYE